MIYYITDENDRVVGQFDGVDVTIKDSHNKNIVDSHHDLPAVDEWDIEYIQS